MKHDHYPPRVLCVSGGATSNEILREPFYSEQFTSGQMPLDATPYINVGGVHIGMSGEDANGTYTAARDFMMRPAA